MSQKVKKKMMRFSRDKPTKAKDMRIRQRLILRMMLIKCQVKKLVEDLEEMLRAIMRIHSL